MRKLYRLFLLAGGGVLLFANLAGCSSDSTNDEPGPIEPLEPEISVEITNDEPSTTSVVLKLQTSGITEYAWQVSEGNVTASPLAEIIFANAQENGQKAEARDGLNEIEVAGLTGNTEYTVFVATRSSEGYEVADVHFTTADYTQRVTVIDIEQFGLKFHVKAESDQYFRWAIYDYETYQGMRQYGAGDVDLLLYGGALAQGEQTIYAQDGKMADGSEPEDPEWDYPMSVKPGVYYVVLVGQCDADGNVMWESSGGGDDDDMWLLSVPATRSASENLGDYTETCPDDWYAWTGFYARQLLWAAPPTQGPSEVKVEVTAQTARRVSFHLTPTEDMLGYGVLSLPVSEWESWVEMFGESGAQAMLANGYSQMMTGEQDLDVDDLVVGEKYYLLILSTFSEDYSVQTFQKVPFEAKESTMPAAEVVVRGIDAPAGAEQTGPYYVWFNIKAPNKDVYAAKYSCEYTKNWVGLINGGESTINQTLESYGVALGADQIASINSDAGLNMAFSSWENTESRLYVQSFNADEVANIYWGASTSPEEPDQARVESSLFSDLLGDWTAVYTIKSGTSTKELTFKVTIADAPECPEGAISADLKSSLTDYYVRTKGISEAEAAALVEQEYANYQARAKRYGEKYRGQNRLVCRGLEYSSTSYYQLGYTSPWDLFGKTTYSAYSTDDLFYDYGSKWFLEIGKDDAGNDLLKVATNYLSVAPVQNGLDVYGSEFRLGFRMDYYSYFTLDFPVELSDDKNTLTVKGITAEDTSGVETAYYPSVCYIRTGYVFTGALGGGDLVLTRGWSGASTTQQSALRVQQPEPQNGRNNRFYRTKLPVPGFGKTPCGHTVLTPMTQRPCSERVARMAEALGK